MSVRFFGQFLIDQGEVDASHIRLALEEMNRANSTLGELAVRESMLDVKSVARVNAEQRKRDLPFGDLAVELGLLSADALVELLRIQTEERVPIGQALVGLGFLEEHRLGLLLDAYKADQAPYVCSRVELPDGLASHTIARYVLELLPRFLLRVASIEAKVGPVQEFSTAPNYAEVAVSVPLRGARGVEAGLVCDFAFAEAVAVAAGGLSREELDPELLADGVGEFLNVLGGNAASALTQQGHRVDLGPPDYEAELCDGWTAELVAGSGRAALVLSTF